MCTAVSPSFEAFRCKGRVGCFIVDACMAFPVRIVVVYGYTNGGKCREQREKTSQLMSAVFGEIGMQPEVPTIVCGDINCQPEMLGPLREKMEAGEFVDVATLPGLGRQQDMLAPTCFAHSAKEGSRRDFVFVQPCLAQMVCSFLVRTGAGYDVHAPVRVAFRVPQSIM
eukprot:6926346-Alexandrium_andersonii.AAC.1